MIASAIAFLCIHLSEPTVTSKNDLKFVQGKFKDYSFIRGNRGYYNYTFRINNCATPFKIKADFLEFFNKQKFEQMLYGEDLIIALPAKQFEESKSSKSDVPIYGLASKSDNLLDYNKTIKKQSSPFVYYASAAIFLLGVFLLYLGKKSKIVTPIW